MKRPPAPEARPRGAPLVVRIAVPVVILFVSFTAFYPALDAEFVSYDDDRLFVNNTSYRGLDPEHVRWMFTTSFMGHYQPLTWMSSALDYKISGMEPASYHRNNLILHSLNGLLLYFVAMRLLAAALRLEQGSDYVSLRLASAAAALFFSIHPLRVESVAWASERRDVLSVFFLLLALLAYLRAFRREESSIRSPGWFVASLGLLVLSLLSKAWGMSFVLWVIILDVYPLRRLPPKVSQWWSRSYRIIWLQKIPFLLLGLAAAGRAGWAQRSALDTMKTLEEWGILNRVVQAFYGLAFYAGKTVWPTRLAPCYELPYRLNPFELRYVVAFLAVLAGLVAIALLRRRVPALLAASAIYIIVLAPVLGFAQSGPQFVADKYSYVACIGWALLAGGALLLLWRSGSPVRRAVSGTTVGMILVVLFIATWRQTSVWHDSRSLWGHQAALGIPSALANLNYGIALRQEGQTDEAITHYRKAVEIRPDSGNAWFALGNALKQAKKDYGEAEKAYRQAVQFMTQKQSGYLNLGNMYYNNMGRVDDAIAAYRAAVEHVEAYRSKMFTPTPYLALGIALHEKGDIDEAREMLEVARKYKKTRAQADAELARLPKGD